MKRLILLAVMLAVCNADNIAMASSNTDKTQKTYNAIPVAPQKSSADIYYAQQYAAPVKQQVHYQAMVSPPVHNHISPTSPPGYLQFVPRHAHQYYLPAQSHPTPTAIMIIAHPALVPQHLLYGHSAMQQLLNYFHSNPHAKYQLLQGNYAGAVHSSPAPQYSQAAHSIPQYQYVSAPTTTYPGHYGNYIPVPVQHSQAAPVFGQYQTPQYQTPHSGHQYSLNQIASLAAQAQTQHGSTYLPANNQQSSIISRQPIRQAPAIITGLENFSPEQQAQIKQQLSSQLGPLTTFSGAGGSSGTGSSQYGAQQTAYGGSSSKVLGNKITDSAEQKSDEPFVPFDPSYRTISSSDSMTSTSSKS